MVNMPQAGLLDKGRLPNDMQGVLLEEQAAGGVACRTYMAVCLIPLNPMDPYEIH